MFYKGAETPSKFNNIAPEFGPEYIRAFSVYELNNYKFLLHELGRATLDKDTHKVTPHTHN